MGRRRTNQKFPLHQRVHRNSRRLMDSEFQGPVNIGSEEMVTINQLVETAAKVAGKEVRKVYKLDAPLGVRGRNSNNDVIREQLGWDYSQSLEEGIRMTYDWISEQIRRGRTCSMSWRVSLLDIAINDYCEFDNPQDFDVYQYGVFNGGSMKEIANILSKHKKDVSTFRGFDHSRNA